MENKIKTIGVLTSGGDSPGMNACIRAVVRTAIAKGLKVKGIQHGYQGLLDGEIFDMNIRSVSNIISLGGTILQTARCLDFIKPEGQERGKQRCIEYGIDGLVIIGGDGSFQGAQKLSNLGIPCIGIPGTIDNDIVCTDYTIGYDTAMNTAMEMIDKLRDTAQSHERCSVVEVMGRHAGHIALNVGVATGASVILLPEEGFDLQKDLIDRVNDVRKQGKKYFIVVVSEGVSNAESIGDLLQSELGIDARRTVLGHVQRGGSPTLVDRVVATKMGFRAVQLLCNNIGNRVVCMKDSHIVDYEINEGLSMKKTIDEELYIISKYVSF